MDNNHTRILQVRLQLIENNLRDMISKLKHDANDSSFILYSIKYDIDQERKITVLNILNFMLDEINQMKDKFALKSEEQPFLRSITVDLDEIFLTLEDTRPETFSKGYGDISNVDQELLRYHILKMLGMVNDISVKLGHTRP